MRGDAAGDTEDSRQLLEAVRRPRSAAALILWRFRRRSGRGRLRPADAGAFIRLLAPPASRLCTPIWSWTAA